MANEQEMKAAEEAAKAQAEADAKALAEMKAALEAKEKELSEREEAIKKAEAKAKKTPAAEPVPADDPMREKVKIKVLKGDGIKKEVLFVSVNGENFVIQRGKEVEVPRYVAEVIQHMEEADELAEERMEAAVKKGEEV